MVGPAESTGSTPEELQVRLGVSIRALRRKHSFTLKQLAELSDLSHSFLSQLELGQAQPSMSSLHRIARALGTTQPALMSAPAPGRVTAGVSLVPAGTGLPVDNVGGTARSLAAGAHALYPLLFEGASEEFGPYYAHDAEEFIFLISGAIEVEITGQGVFRLQVGDTLHYSAGLQHRWRRTGPGDLRALFVQEAAPSRRSQTSSS